MDITNPWIFMGASALVAIAPGPSTLLVLSHALSHDIRRPVSLIVGAFCANVLLVTMTALGVSALVVASQTAFEVLRWIGAGYLIYLGIRYWRAPADPVRGSPDVNAGPYRALFFQAFLTSLTNPKGLVFYFAFLPQFVSPDHATQGQLFVLGFCYVAIFMAALLIYALAGRTMVRIFSSSRAVRIKNRMTGGFLVAAGLSLLRYQRP